MGETIELEIYRVINRFLVVKIDTCKRVRKIDKNYYNVYQKMNRGKIKVPDRKMVGNLEFSFRSDRTLFK